MNHLKGVSLYQRFIQSLVVPMSSANKKLLKFKRNNEPYKVFLMMVESISECLCDLF
jgi:hypothetical protein